MNRALLIDSDNLSMRFSLACMLAAELDDKDSAIMLLQRTFSYMSRYQLGVAESHPDLESLREDSRFVSMLARARERLGLSADRGDGSAAAQNRTNRFTQRPLS
jgi:hypothetical protein